MTATFYRSIEIRTSPNDLLINGRPFFQNQNNYLVVLAEKSHTTSPNSSSQWSIDYIGSIRDFFLKYCAYFSNSFQDGLISTNLAYNGVDCYRALEVALKKAISVNTDDFNSRQIESCTWASSQYLQLQMQWPELTPVIQCGHVRYVQFLRSHFDITSLFRQAIHLHKILGKQTISQLVNKTPWVFNDKYTVRIADQLF